MNTEKRCIFHIPYKIDPNVKSGTNIRPVKMKEAFEANEYEVDCIWGYGRERKERISAIKKKIQQLLIKKSLRLPFVVNYMAYCLVCLSSLSLAILFP